MSIGVLSPNGSSRYSARGHGLHQEEQSVQWGMAAKPRATAKPGEWILQHVAETFDPAKCCGPRYRISFGKYDKWAHAHAFGGIRGRDRRFVDEYGNVVVKKSRRMVGWQFVSAFLSVIEFCLISDPNEDGSLPQDRAEDLWDGCFKAGLIKVPFCEKKWSICRDWLEEQGVIKIVDRRYWRGRAMRWAVSTDLDRMLAEWWRKKRKPSLIAAVSLQEFLSERRNCSNKALLNSYPTQGGLKSDESGDLVASRVRPPP